MAETYLQLAQQIEALQQRAASVKEREVTEVIERIKLAIEAYGLTVEQLFGDSRGRNPGAKTSVTKPGPKSTSARFRDDAGNVWSGRGPRPRWLKAALAAGKSMEEFAVARGNGGGAAQASKRTAKSPLTPKYKDEAGNSWSGRGPKPGWFKAALDAGKTLEQLAA